MEFSYKIEVYEGSMDILLNLISKNKINIYDIPISTLLEQYMEQINALKGQDMQITSEFLDMAARLVYIKSLSLLPKFKEEEEELKRELVGQLLEYQMCKEVAQKLSRQVDLDKLVRNEEKIPLDLRYKREHDAQELIKYYFLAVGRGKRFLPPPKDKFSGIISHKIVSVSSQIVFVLRKLVKNRQTSFSQLFENKIDRSERVATFLAVLELVKGNRVLIEETEDDIKLVLQSGGTREH
ncbi:MAG: segregation/condensation protein A [Clostridia bacterium]